MTSSSNSKSEIREGKRKIHELKSKVKSEFGELEMENGVAKSELKSDFREAKLDLRALFPDEFYLFGSKQVNTELLNQYESIGQMAIRRYKVVVDTDSDVPFVQQVLTVEEIRLLEWAGRQLPFWTWMKLGHEKSFKLMFQKLRDKAYDAGVLEDVLKGDKIEEKIDEDMIVLCDDE